MVNVKFINCKLEWSDFSKTRLRNVSFERAKLSWSKFNNAHFENINMRRADLSYTLMFNLNLKQADLTDAITFKLTRSEDQLEKEGIEKSKTELTRLKSSAPFETWLRIKFSVGQVEEKFGLMSKIGTFLEDIHHLFTKKYLNTLQVGLEKEFMVSVTMTHMRKGSQRSMHRKRRKNTMSKLVAL